MQDIDEDVVRKLAEYDTGDLIITIKRAFMDFFVPE